MPRKPAKADRSAIAEPLRVLIVDDDKVDRLALARRLGEVGLDLTIHEAEGVLRAIEMLSAEQHDCVLLDYHLPDGDGLTFLRGLRRAGISTSVVMITGQDDEQITKELLAAGAIDYIPKAKLSRARLAQSLALVLERRRNETSA